MTKRLRQPACFIDFDDWDETKYPIPPEPVTPSKTECHHTPTPTGYGPFIGWAKKADEAGYKSIKCPHCGLFSIWIRK